jgi:hypothetical protein
MAIYLSRKKGGTVATPITPSNANPAQMATDTPVNPTANGYAIESYNTKTPSNSSPVALASGEIDKTGGNGYAIESYSSVTPSNSSPATITSGSIYKASANGKAVASITDITPSNSSPAQMTANTPVNPTANGYAVKSYTAVTPSSTEVGVNDGDVIVVRAQGVVMNPPGVSPSNSSPTYIYPKDVVRFLQDGYAIKSYTAKTPSDSSPASVSSGAIIKASSSGYLYSSSGLGKCKAGAFTTITTGSQTINLGFQPKYIMVMSEGRTINIYDYSYSSTKAVYATTSTYPTEYTISGNTSNNRISAISSTGFTFNKSGTAGATEYYFAMA